jgi:hypothetical protein
MQAYADDHIAGWLYASTVVPRSPLSCAKMDQRQNPRPNASLGVGTRVVRSPRCHPACYRPRSAMRRPLICPALHADSSGVLATYPSMAGPEVAFFHRPLTGAFARLVFHPELPLCLGSLLALCRLLFPVVAGVCYLCNVSTCTIRVVRKSRAGHRCLGWLWPAPPPSTAVLRRADRSAVTAAR